MKNTENTKPTAENNNAVVHAQVAAINENTNVGALLTMLSVLAPKSREDQIRLLWSAIAFCGLGGEFEA